jgi:hypothetical protein
MVGCLDVMSVALLVLLMVANLEKLLVVYLEKLSAVWTVSYLVEMLVQLMQLTDQKVALQQSTTTKILMLITNKR